jgi:hypothetical protein
MQIFILMETFTPQDAPMQPSNGRHVIFYWKIVQVLFWVIGIAMLLFMLFLPPVGVTLFWNILIPVAPALLVVGTGLWRNVCPLATTALLPDRFGFSKNIKLTTNQRATLSLIAVIVLFMIIPLRHALFNTNGQATAFLIIGVAVVAVVSGFLFERKSGWCSSLCPVHPVEKLYGAGVAFSLPNLHCESCIRCSEPCPDSTISVSPKALTTLPQSKMTEYILVGAFPGYVWGWFQVPDFRGAAGWENMMLIYGFPVLGALTSLIAYLLLKRSLGTRHEEVLISLFAAAAVSCYYWFRIPQLLGFSSLDTNGTLIDLSSHLPAWTPILINTFTTAFFLWWMVIRKKPMRSWSKRPKYSPVTVLVK